MSTLTLGSLTLDSRLILGTALFPNPETLKNAIEESGTSLVTVAIRRVSLNSQNQFALLPWLQKMNVKILPNTAGCFSAREAILTAKMARESLGIKQIKLEVIGDERSLYPDASELLVAARELIADGFEVFPYCPDDPVVCLKLEAMGCVCVMPLAAPIGSGQGLINPFNLNMIRSRVCLPVIVDAGLGTASDATKAMELGADAVLVNSAIARAAQPVLMAKAFRDAVTSGLAAAQAGRIEKTEAAVPSTSMDDRPRFSFNKM